VLLLRLLNVVAAPIAWISSSAVLDVDRNSDRDFAMMQVAAAKQTPWTSC
jgi:hypothetical protein